MEYCLGNAFELLYVIAECYDSRVFLIRKCLKQTHASVFKINDVVVFPCIWFAMLELCVCVFRCVPDVFHSNIVIHSNIVVLKQKAISLCNRPPVLWWQCTCDPHRDCWIHDHLRCSSLRHRRVRASAPNSVFYNFPDYLQLAMLIATNK